MYLISNWLYHCVYLSSLWVIILWTYHHQILLWAINYTQYPKHYTKYFQLEINNDPFPKNMIRVYHHHPENIYATPKSSMFMILLSLIILPFVLLLNINFYIIMYPHTLIQGNPPSTTSNQPPWNQYSPRILAHNCYFLLFADRTTEQG